MKNYLRKRIYKWHRITSLIVAVPVILWTLSGFLHPVMNTLKPEVRNQSLPPVIIDTTKIRVPLAQALIQHGISMINNFRIIEKHGALYYQVKQPDTDTLTYISCYNGQLMVNGDQQYAAYLAQRYLSDTNGNGSADHHSGIAADLASVVNKKPFMNSHGKTNILDVELVKTFTPEYKSSNILLPVYRVQFDRNDYLRLYIETSSGKLSTAIDSKRSWYIKFFALAHSWSFLNSLGDVKNIIIGVVSLLCFLTSLAGFYVYNITSRKNKPISSHRSWHRAVGNVFVVTTLLYAFSGGWHSLHKLKNEENVSISESSLFSAGDLKLSLPTVMAKIKKDQLLSDISVIKMHGRNYWQITLIAEGKTQKKYREITTLKELPGGDEAYGRYLASRFAGKQITGITHSRRLVKFNDQYSMMKKRLPVIEVSFDEEKNYYVETATGILSAVSSSSDKAERFSFSNLHMHHYWEDWLGKDKGRVFKNIMLISTTLGLLLLAMTGIIMYRKRKLRAVSGERRDTRS